MRCGRHSFGSLRVKSARVQRMFAGLLFACCSLPVVADSTMVYDPFDVPQGAYQASFVEDRDNVSIIEFSGNYDKKLASGQTNAAARAVVAREFYRTHADDYDFLVVFSDFEFNTGEATAFYSPVRNDVQGIGEPQFDLSSIYGSEGKLQGYIDMAALSRYEFDPLKPDYEKSLLTLAHEVLHRWGVSVRFKDDTGQSSNQLLGRQDAHWSFKVDSGASVEYGHDWKDMGNGEFKAIAARRFYSPMDLYLMGFYSADEVPPFFYIESDERDRNELPQPGITISGKAKTVTVDDVIAVEGPRVPSAENAQKSFKFAFVYLKSPSSDIDDANLLAMKRFRENFTTRFSILTGGRAIAHVYPEAKPAGEIGESEAVSGGALRESASSVPEALLWLRNAQTTEGYWGDRPATRLRDTTVLFDVMTTYDGAFSRLDDVEAWLRAQADLNNDSLARRLAVRRSAREREGDLAMLLDRRNDDGGWGVSQGFRSDVMDTALVLRAIAPYVASDIKSGAVNYLQGQQGADGGWPAVESSTSQVTVTALAMDALYRAGVSGDAVLGAADYLKSRQLADGGFGDQNSTVHDTAHVILSMLHVGQLEQIDVASAAAYLSGQQSIAGDWDGSVYTTGLAVSALQSANFANWAITDISASPEGAKDGERVKLSAKVANDGRETSEPTILRVYKGSDPDTATLISDDIAVPAIPPQNAVSVDFYWDSLDQPGSNNFVFSVDPDDNVVERSELDNINQISVDILSAPDGIDLELNDGAVSISPASPYYLPSDLGISVSLRNAGMKPASQALVRLLKIEQGAETVVVADQQVDVPARQTSVINFVDQLTQPGTTRYQAVVDPDGVIDEANEANNSGTGSVTPQDTIDFVVSNDSVSMDPQTAYVGDDVEFTVVIRNQGSLPAPPSKVRYSLVSDGQEQLLRENNIVLGAGESLVHTLTWRVDSTGPKQLIVEMDPDGSVTETDEDNNRYAFDFNADVLEGTNVGVNYADISASPKPLLEGYGATLTAEVKNNGTVALNGLDVRFYNGNPASGGSEIGRTTISSIAAGGRESASVVWDEVPDSSKKLIYVVLDPDNVVDEFDETDNAAFTTIDVKALPDFVVDEGSISLSPAFPKQGEQATIDVSVANAGIQAGTDVPVALYQGSPDAGGTLIGETTIANLAGQGTQVASFDYLFDSTSSDVRLVAVVNKARVSLEKTYQNNRAERSLNVQDSNFYVSERYISPDGDGVQDSSRFSFRLDSAQDVVISIKNSRDREVIAFSGDELSNASAGSIVWDGRNDFGGIVNDDEYSVEVLDNLGEVLGSSEIVVDTNRSSLLKAAGTRYERITDLRALNYNSPFNILGDIGYTLDDEFAIFRAVPQNSDEPKGYVSGIYRSTVYGGQVTPIVDFSSIPEMEGTTTLSSDIVISPKSNAIAFQHGADVWSVDVLGGPVRHLLSPSDLSVDYEGATFDGEWERFLISNDGQWLIYFKSFASSIEIGRIPLDGSQPAERLDVLDNYSSVYRVLPSPSSNRMFAMLEGGNGKDLYYFNPDFTERKKIEAFGNQNPSWSAVGWAPDGHAFAYGDSRYAKLTLLDASGKEIQTKSFFSLDGKVYIHRIQWNQNSIELAYEVERRNEYYSRESVSSVGSTNVDLEASLDGNACDGSDYEPVSGIYNWNTATGEIERPIAVTEIATCIGSYEGFGYEGTGGSAASTYYADGQGQFWLYEKPVDWVWSPGERRLIVVPKAGWGVEGPTNMVAVDVERKGDFERVFEFWPYGYIFNIDVSPTQRRMFIGNVAFESLLNQTVDLRALRSQAAGGVQLSGTAVDLNFDHYELDYAASGDVLSWRQVNPDSLIPVVDDDMTTWVPPKPGSYYLRLTAKDKAGNVRSDIQRTAWGEQAALTDLYRDPGYISPNGDGIQDTVTLHMQVLQPANLTLEVYNEQNQIVRTIRKSFDLIGAEQSIVWDGRDDRGVTVADGIYRLELGKYKYEVTVDASAPEITLGDPGDLLQPSCDPRFLPGCEPEVALDLDAWYQIEDANYHLYRIEKASDNGGWTVLREDEFGETDGKFSLAIKNLNDLNKGYRLVAEDLAGNRAVANFQLSPKRGKVIFAEAGRQLDEDGNLNFDSKEVPFANYDAFPSEPVGTEFNLSRFKIVESVQKAINSVSVVYREVGQDDSAWREIAVTDFVKKVCSNPYGKCESYSYAQSDRDENSFEFLFDAAQLNESSAYELKVKLVDVDGKAYTSNGILVTRVSSFYVKDLIPWLDTTYQVTTVHDKPPFEIANEYITVQSDMDSRYLEKTKIGVSTLQVSDPMDSSIPAKTITGYFLHDIVPCAEYTLEYVLVDEFGNTATSDPLKVTKGCTQLQYVVQPVPPEACGEGPSNLLSIRTGIFRPDSPYNETGETDKYQVLVWQIDGPDGGEDKVLFTENNPELGKYYSFDFDTSEYPEGKLDITIRAVKASGEAETQPIQLPIDHTPPEATILSPENEGKVCAAEFQDSKGNAIRGALIQADIMDQNGAALAYAFKHQVDEVPAQKSDAFFMDPTGLPELNTPLLTNDKKIAEQAEKSGKASDAIRYADSGEPVFSVPARKTLSGNLKALGDVGFVKLNGTSDIDFEVEVTDFGTYKQCLSQRFHLDASIEGLRSLSRHSIISPNGDGNLDSAVVDLSVEEDVTVGMAIHTASYNSSEGEYSVVEPALFNVVDDMQVGAGNTEIQWDGTDGSALVPDGHYYMVLTVRDACGNTNVLKYLIEVDATDPVVDLSYPQTGDPLSLNTEVMGSVSDENLTTYRLEYRVGGADNWAYIAGGRTNVLNDVLGNWNTFGLEGDTTLRLSASDRAGNQSIVERALVVQERTNLLSYIDTNTPYISPNGDGAKDTGRITVGILEPVTLEINLKSDSGETLSNLVTGQDVAPGEFVFNWNGKSDQSVVADGKYHIEVIARSQETTGLQQTEGVTIGVDTIAPAIGVEGIEDGFATSSIRGSVTDVHLESYTYSRTDTPGTPDWTDVISGEAPITGKLLEALSPNDGVEGEYGLRLFARDRAGNASEKVLSYIIDLTPPSIDVLSPAVGDVTGDLLESMEVSGSIEDKYFSQYSIAYRSDGTSDEVELFRSESLPATDTLANLNVNELPEGNQVLVIEASDRAGHISRQEISVHVDNSAPEVAISTPLDGDFVTGPYVVTGSVNDAHLDSYVVAYAAGADAANDEAWNTIVQGTRAVSGGNLAYVSDLPTDGTYTIRVLAKDVVGHEASASKTVEVDTQPPATPEWVSVVPAKDEGIRLKWSAVGAEDLAGYLVERAGTLVTPEPISGTELLDAVLAEGTYTYRLIAEDLAGNRSEPSDERTVRVDWTPPDVSLTNPTDNSLVSGLVNVRGTAYSEDDFAEYRLSLGVGDDPQGWQVFSRSTLALISSELAQLNTLELDDSQRYTLRLEAEDLAGNTAEARMAVHIDNTAPDAPTGLVATLTDNNVSLSWDANTDEDLAGYYLFADGRLVNADGTVVGDLSPYIISDVAYDDTQKPDGVYEYLLYAVDKAGNVSGSSEPVKVEIETRPPHITFESPADQGQFENTLGIEGVSQDTDVSKVRYVYRSAGSAEAWSLIAEVTGDGPYSYSWDTSALEYGDYELRAEATDTHGNVDPDPEVLSVSKVDQTRPEQVVGLSAAVTGGSVELSWNESQDADLAGYFIERSSGTSSSVRLNSQPLTQASYTDSGVEDDLYHYEVIAVDLSGNESEISAPVNALVFTPQVEAPFSPTSATTTSLKGKVVEEIVNGQAEGTVDNILGLQNLPSTALDETRSFQWQAVDLQPGENTLTTLVADGEGNQSKEVVYSVMRADPPEPPKDLAVAVNGESATISWTANSEANIAGYRVFDGEGEPLLANQSVQRESAEGTPYYSWGYFASSAIDGSIYTNFRPDQDYESGRYSPLTVHLKEPSFVSEVRLIGYSGDSDYIPDTYDVEVWTGTYWLTLASATKRGESTLEFSAPYMTDKIRIVPTSSCHYACLFAELQVYKSPLVHDVEYTALNQSNGYQTYSATAVNSLGLESAFATSNEVAVGDVQPPEPVVLSGAVVNEHDASLSWEQSISPDAYRYRIYRDDELISVRPVSASQFLDQGLKNGTYTYHVVTEDAAGNLSDPSNLVSVEVAAPVEPSPTSVAVSALPEGEKLSVQWQHGNPADLSFTLYRSDSLNGPYAAIGSTTSRSYLDEGLTNGKAYFYRVTATDAQGNESAPSDSATGIPADTLAPGKPTLLSPVLGGESAEIAEQTTVIAGLAEPGAKVAAFISGNMNSPVTALATSDATYLPYFTNSAGKVSPDGKELLISYSGRVGVVNIKTDEAVWIGGNGIGYVPDIAWSGMDRAVGYAKNSENFRYQPILVDIENRSLQFANMADTENVLWMDYSAKDSKWLVFVDSYDPDFEIGIYQLDPITGETANKYIVDDWGDYPNTMAYSAATNTVAWIDSTNPNGSYAISLLNLDTMQRTYTVASASTGNDTLDWNQDGTSLLYVTSNDTLARYDIDSGSTVPIQIDASDDFWSVQYGDNDRFFARTYSTLFMGDVATGEAVPIYSQSSYDQRIDDFEWVAKKAYISFKAANSRVFSLKPEGRFETAPITLSDGENSVFAIAQDEAGNESEPSKTATLIYRQSDNPDLAVNASLNPRIPVVSNTVELNLEISNVGEMASPESTLTVAVVSPDGDAQTLRDREPLSPLAAGATMPQTLRWQVPAAPGEYNLIVAVDEQNLIQEVSETNNTIIQSISVVDSGNVSLETSLNDTDFVSNSDLQATVRMVNPGGTFEGNLSVWIEDLNGYGVVQLLDTPETISAGSSETVDVDWNTGSIFAGDYVLVAEMVNADGESIASSSSAFTIDLVVNPVLAVRSNKAIYGPNETVTLDADISNEEANSSLTGLELALNIQSPDGSILFEASEPVAEINPGDVQSVTSNWNTANTAPGEFSVVAKLVDSSGDTLAESSNQFQIKPGVPVLPATLKIGGNYPVGEALQPTYSVTNEGNSEVADLALSLSLIRMADSALIGESPINTDLSVGDTYSGSAVFATANLPLGQYKVQLAAEYPYGGVQQRIILATQFVSLFDADAPSVSVLGPQPLSVVNGRTAKAAVSASDGLSGVHLVELQIDGQDWVPLPSAAVNYFYALSELAEGTHTIAARATDNAGNTSNPVSVSFTIDNEVPGIGFSGVEDSVHYNHAVVPEVMFDGASRTRVQLNGDDFVSGTTVSAEGAYRLYAYAEDEAGNNVRRSLDFVVDKTKPVVNISGVADGELYNKAVTPHIEVDELYLDMYEVTLNDESFESDTPISEDGKYELHVVARDKAGNSQEAVLTFEIDTTAPDAPVITNISDGDVLDAGAVNIVGKAEPKSVIDISFGETHLSTLVDDTGAFAFSDLELEEGQYSFRLTATDRAGNTSAERVLTVTVRAKKKLNIEGYVTAKSHVLVWIPEHPGRHHGQGGHHQEDEFDQLIQLVGETYESRDIDYSVVRNESDFVREMRTQRYNVLLIGSLKPALGHPMKMSYSTELEIRGVVGAGTGLIWINNHMNLFELWHDMIGARSVGAVPHIENVYLDDSPASTDGAWEYNGHHGVRVALTGGVGIGQLEVECKPHWHLWTYYADCDRGWWHHDDDEHRNPALVINKYGAGSVAMFTFNPEDLVDSGSAQEMIDGVTAYATPSAAEKTDDSMVDIEWRISEAVPPLSIAAVQKVSESMKVIGANGGDVVDAQTATWSRELNSPTSSLTSQVRLQEEDENAQASIEVYETAVGAGTLLAQNSLDVDIVFNQSDIELAYMDALEAIDYSLLEYWPVHKAMIYAQSAMSRDLSRRSQLEWAIWDVKKSLSWLSHVERDKTGEAIVWGGKLLKQYQALWEQSERD